MTQLLHPNQLKAAVGTYVRRQLGLAPGALMHIFNADTDQVHERLEAGEKPTIARKGKILHMADGPTSDVRADENYLFSTRRFPSNTANNTIGSGAVVAGDYPFFTFGVGDLGTVAGYFSLTNLTNQQTNMDAGGKIALGRGFEMYSLGVSFNAAAINADIVQLMDTMNLRFDKQGGQYIIQHGPLKMWPGGTGSYGFAATTATTTTLQAASNGMPAVTNQRTLRLPRVLSANETFAYIINAAANTPNVNAAVALSAFVEVTIWLFGYVLNRVPS